MNWIRANAWWYILVVGAVLAVSLGDGHDGELKLAYLDPGSGSLVIQAVVASLAGIAMVVRTYWARIRIFFGKGSAEGEDAPAVSSSQDDNE